MHQINAETRKSGSKFGEETYVKLRNDGEKYQCLGRSYTKASTKTSTAAFLEHHKIKTQAPGCAKSSRFNAIMETYRRGSTLNINCAERCAHVSKPLRERDVSKDDLLIPENSYNEHNQTRGITKISTLSPRKEQQDLSLSSGEKRLYSCRRKSETDANKPESSTTRRLLFSSERRHSEPVNNSKLIADTLLLPLPALPTPRDKRHVKHFTPKIANVTLTPHDEDVFCFDQKEEVVDPKPKTKKPRKYNWRWSLVRSNMKSNKLKKSVTFATESDEGANTVTPVYIETWRKEGLDLRRFKRVEWFSSPMTFI